MRFDFCIITGSPRGTTIVDAIQTQIYSSKPPSNSPGVPEGSVKSSRIDEQTRPLEIVQRRTHSISNCLLPGAPVRMARRHSVGGSGVVYRATQMRSGSALAVKLQRDDRPAHAKSLLREIQVLRHIDSPWVVRFERAGTLPDGRPWLAMEYLEGPSLAHLTKKESLDHRQVVRWLRQVCRGLAAIHGAGWVHRDIKPSNIVRIRASGVERIKLIDLGIAERIGTQPEALCGTPEYIAPEQAQNKPADIRSDIYSLGCCAYKLLTNHEITAARGAIAKINAHIDGIKIEWPPSHGIPYVLRRLIERCVRRAPEGRPPNAHVLEAELARVQRALEHQAESETESHHVDIEPVDTTTIVHEPITAANDVPRPRRRKRVRLLPLRWRTS